MAWAASGHIWGLLFLTLKGIYFLSFLSVAWGNCMCVQVRAIILDSIADDGWWRLAFLVVTCIWVLWLLFLMNCVVGNLRLMLGPVAQVTLPKKRRHSLKKRKIA